MKNLIRKIGEKLTGCAMKAREAVICRKGEFYVDKLICVWGIPYSGKTFLSVKLSERLSREKHGLASVMTVMTDMYTPSLPVIFPSYPPGEIFSLGEVTQRGSVSWDGILSGTVLVRGKRSSGVLGYAHGENMYSYPAYDADTAKGMQRIGAW